LGGVEDKAMYPIRGQTVLLRAPWVKYGRTMVETDGRRTYTIPRRCGDVCLSCFLSVYKIFNPKNYRSSWEGLLIKTTGMSLLETSYTPEFSNTLSYRYPTPRPEITKDILNRVFTLCPELTPPEIRATREPKVEDMLPLIVEEGCGLRPARNGGVRIEAEWFEDVKGQRKVPVIHNYGHGGFGYQSSWGSASVALELLEGAFKEKHQVLSERQ
jgi:glycine/D-amino acid oxidase-like deaminating enzyme